MKFIVRVVFFTELFIFSGVFIYRVIWQIPPEASTRVIEQRLALKAAGYTGGQLLLTNKYLESYRYHLGKILRKADFGYYFFANHPREIPGEVNKQILPFFILPFIIAGVVRIRGNWGYLWGCLILGGFLCAKF
jgi:hypothetical protein